MNKADEKWNRHTERNCSIILLTGHSSLSQAFCYIGWMNQKIIGLRVIKPCPKHGPHTHIVKEKRRGAKEGYTCRPMVPNILLMIVSWSPTETMGQAIVTLNSIESLWDLNKFAWVGIRSKFYRGWLGLIEWFPAWLNESELGMG